MLLESAQRDRTEEPCKQVVARRFLTIHQTRMVGRADDRSDFIVAVYDILGAAQLPWNSKAGRAIDTDSVAHDWLSKLVRARSRTTISAHSWRCSA